MNEFKVGDKVRVKEFDCMALVSEVGSKQDRVAVHFENNEGFWTYLGDAIGVSLELVERAAPVAPMTADIAGIREQRIAGIQALVDKRFAKEVEVARLEQQNTAFFGTVTISALYSDIEFIKRELASHAAFLLDEIAQQKAENAALRQQLAAATGALEGIARQRTTMPRDIPANEWGKGYAAAMVKFTSMAQDGLAAANGTARNEEAT